MATKKIRGKDLRKIGFPEGKLIGIIIDTLQKHYKRESRQAKLDLTLQLHQNPESFKNDEFLGPIVAFMLEADRPRAQMEMLANRIPYETYGAAGIEPGAIHQMEVAMRLPVTVAGALMPDAHQGYGLPIGGVLATENAVIPYGVGVDIGCRMCLSFYDIPVSYLKGHRDKMKKMLEEHTRFGQAEFEKPMDDEVLDRKEFKEIQVVRNLHGRAWKQIGSSGGGNHFVEFGIVQLKGGQNEWDLPQGEYLAVLSHSGSRGLGANIARHYTKLAMENRQLPKEAKHLAWLALDTEIGQEYWQAMNLAGDYASACHHQIHHRLGKALGEKPLAMVENHHNFAWKEKLPDGKEVIVHRKGATPAGKGVLGIIPGSMTAPGFVVRGKGEPASLASASHGAGRVLSRTKAKNSITQSEVNKLLKEHGVELIGGGLDEAPHAYKDIRGVMAAQAGLVETLATFTPKIVRMA